MRETGRLPLPLRKDGPRWSTVVAERSVLGVVHNITSATRLLDLLAVFEGDERVQVFFTRTGSSELDGGTEEFLTSRGMARISWQEALSQPFDLAVATSRGGELHRIPFPLVGAPHGAGYNKVLSRERKSGAFGLTSEWLVHEGRVVPAAIVLSHDEQLRRLADGCPEAVPRAVVAGDPCLDQLRAGLAFRAAYRRALGLLPGQRLVVVSSTWGRGSVLGTPGADVLRRALAELPADEFRVLAAVHPNAWYGHGAWQICHWLAPLTESGMLLPAPETETWKAALCAADFLIGDHGSLTMYGTALGIPCVLGAFDDSAVAPDSPMDRLGRLLPRLSRTVPLLPQLLHAARTQPDDPGLAALRQSVSSAPGESARRLRRLFYSRLKLPEPAHPAATRAIPVPSPGPAAPRLPHLPATLVTATADDEPGDGVTVRVRRFPATAQRTQSRHLADAHLAADPDDPDPRWPRSADVLLVPAERGLLPDEVSGSSLARRFPGCALVAVEEAGHGCTALFGDGTRLRARWAERPAWASFAVAASAAYAWAGSGPVPLRPGVRARLTVRAGDHPEAGLVEFTVP
ncbi:MULTISPECIES: hypothetical protein [Streptomyces]|uniref:Translation initiation factor IF-2 n=1 Tax=Streptomyces eurythermus TaxID=42237 RepID=A0ABW6ZBB6_9ACTN|nr:MULTISPECIES: hypothetical protein [Streptomyces]QIS74334.1 hypothetical protein HB370_33735 [Streptomyces sp. DSM 40868]